MLAKNGLIEKSGLDALRKYCGLSPEAVAEMERIVICDSSDMPDRWEDCIIFKTIFLPIGITAMDKTWRIAHCLGHYFQHAKSIWGWGKMWCYDKNDIRSYGHELQADVFAACMVGHMEE